ncbi:MAG: branched-chain amino acid ABC transporter permease [Proteobacteria bacterium]|nr:branched-chain amino acid ABC transporter permease [Pseudomonadota bacterium]
MTIDLAGLLAYAASFGVLAAINVVICLSLELQWGRAGLFNAGVAGFVAVGAYASALLTAEPAAGHLAGPGLPVIAGLAAGSVTAGALSVAVGSLARRLRGDYLAIATFGAAVVLELLLRNLTPLTGGPLGLAFIPRPFAGLADRPLAFALASFAWVGFIALVLYVGIGRLVDGPWGRTLRAVRDDERAAASLGKSPVRFRLEAFALGGALMGLGGALKAHTLGFIAPEHFPPTLTFQVWAMLVLGGAGRRQGAVLGAVLVTALWSATDLLLAFFVPAGAQAQLAPLRIVVVGALLALGLLWRPRGLLAERLRVSRYL